MSLCCNLLKNTNILKCHRLKCNSDRYKFDVSSNLKRKKVKMLNERKFKVRKVDSLDIKISKEKEQPFSSTVNEDEIRSDVYLESRLNRYGQYDGFHGEREFTLVANTDIVINTASELMENSSGKSELEVFNGDSQTDWTLNDGNGHENEQGCFDSSLMTDLDSYIGYDGFHGEREFTLVTNTETIIDTASGLVENSFDNMTHNYINDDNQGELTLNVGNGLKNESSNFDTSPRTNLDSNDGYDGIYGEREYNLVAKTENVMAGNAESIENSSDNDELDDSDDEDQEQSALNIVQSQKNVLEDFYTILRSNLDGYDVYESFYNEKFSLVVFNGNNFIFIVFYFESVIIFGLVVSLF
ncbi:uncharacterized protein LOC126903902 [Daktulosphaira vitifoliae]|uniref:uncharacterized protein LOC126903902 n=1 Tax=Daktulosphaira vitifoliae TaxID=58002 RepID=UPI0021AA38B6|nr:uncharacterized protein LOC126903902 [Daktulosphaira vitifoliae]